MAKTNTSDIYVKQAAKFLNDVETVRNGGTVSTGLNFGSFVEAATHVLRNGYDPILNSISVVLSRTIFAVRPYERLFKGLERSAEKWGNHVRKISYADLPAEDNQAYPDSATGYMADGTSVDQYTILKQPVVQMNFYDEQTYRRKRSFFEDQLDSAFQNAGDLMQFWGGVVQTVSDEFEVDFENGSRACLANLVLGTMAANIDSVATDGTITYKDNAQMIHLLSEYNEETGGNYTQTTIKAPDVYPAFVKWAFARVASASSMMRERLTIHHCPIDLKNSDNVSLNVKRHTPYNRQQMYILANTKYNVEDRVLADTFHDSYLNLAYNEAVNYWMDPADPATIKGNAKYMKPDMTTANTTSLKPHSYTGSEPFQITAKHLVGILMDEDAAGYTLIGDKSRATPPNAAADYYNMFWKRVFRYYNDFSENCILIFMD